MSLSSAIAAVLAIQPESRAIKCGDRWWSWGELGVSLRDLEAVLDNQGVDPSLGIGVIPRSNFACAAALLAVLHMGRTIVSISHIQPDADLTEEIRTLRVGVLVADEQSWERPGVVEAVKAIGALGVVADQDGNFSVRVAGPVAWDESYYRPDPDAAVELQTSGTTGPPKRIPLGREYLAKAFGVADSVRTDRLSRSTAIIVVPLVHVSGLHTFMDAVMHGRSVVLFDRFAVASWAAAIAESKTVAATLPPTGVAMVMDSDTDPAKLASLRFLRVGTAPLDVGLWERFEKRFGIPLITVYGATEFTTPAAGWTVALHKEWIDRKRGSAGRPQPGVQMRVLDRDNGEVLPPGREGLLQVKAAHIKDGDWVGTNDVGVIDEDEFVWIRGRADETIIRGGFKVSLPKVRTVLETHPDVFEASVIGLKDERLGEVPGAVVEWSPAATERSADAVRAWSREHLRPYEVPVRLVGVESLPRTPSMKVPRPEIARILEDR